MVRRLCIMALLKTGQASGALWLSTTAATRINAEWPTGNGSNHTDFPDAPMIM